MPALTVARIAFIVGNDERLSLVDERIEKNVEATKARLLIIDPIQAYLAQDYDMQNAIRMRTVLGGLSDLAAKYRCAIVLVGHMNKASGGKDLYRGLGSIDIAAIARSVLMIARDREPGDSLYDSSYPVLRRRGAPLRSHSHARPGFSGMACAASIFTSYFPMSRSTIRRLLLHVSISMKC
jgi:hypothetical protein